MRVLVEQTVERIRTEFAAVEGGDVAVHQLMGGAVAREWIERPEDDAVIVGTLDQLFSRALMRGYGVSRYAWPIHFALLHNDALWVYDEVQLMGEALATSTQLDGFRARFQPGVGPTGVVWMSATVDPSWLESVDRSAPTRVLTVGEDDRSAGLGTRLAAQKSVTVVAVIDAATIRREHLPGTLTLAVVNTVATAREIAGRLAREKGNAPEVVLVHSRFRPGDRRETVARLTAPVDASGPGRIAVTTQVVEAGVDISAVTLLTEAAPWASLVQRFGRVNRRGEIADARVIWAPPSRPAPYDAGEVDASARLLAELEGTSVGPDALEKLDAPLAVPSRRFVLRRRDFLGLFDTSPDLSGLDLDVRRFIRDGDDLTVGVAWRELGTHAPGADDAALAAEELCPVAISELRDVLRKRNVGSARSPSMWRFDPIVATWTAIRPDDLRPGDDLVTDLGFGCYAPARGFDPRLEDLVAPVMPLPEDVPEGTESDTLSERRGVWLSIAEHTNGVCETLEGLLKVFKDRLSDMELEALRRAARLHDHGKAHEVFQVAMRAGGVPPERADQLVAKREGRADRYARPRFRHELASLLAYLATPAPDALTAYLIGAHHGRVRLGARPLPGEWWPEDGRAFMLGCWEGDALPETDVGLDAPLPAVELNFEPMALGCEAGQTYSDIALGLLAELGPYRLAFLEALLRTADTRRSTEEARGHA